jgi:hypothetical protein
MVNVTTIIRIVKALFGLVLLALLTSIVNLGINAYLLKSPSINARASEHTPSVEMVHLNDEVKALLDLRENDLTGGQYEDAVLNWFERTYLKPQGVEYGKEKD